MENVSADGNFCRDAMRVEMFSFVSGGGAADACGIRNVSTDNAANKFVSGDNRLG